jgi:hypothetical protein
VQKTIVPSAAVGSTVSSRMRYPTDWGRKVPHSPIQPSIQPSTQ